MAKRLSTMVVFAAMVVAVLLQSSEAQTTHVVGDSLGWSIPPGGPIAYSTWASTKTFSVGDVLLFNYTSGHDVAEVTQAAFDACNTNNPISVSSTTGPINIQLSSAGQHYYICTISTHCSLGQKLAINVSSSSSATPSPESAPPPPPPPSSSAPSITVATLPAVALLSIIVALCH